MIKPDSLAEFAKNAPSIEAAGRVLYALAGRPVPGLEPMEKAMVAVISYDTQKMETHLEERREKWRERQSNHRKTIKKAKVAEDVTLCHGDTPPILPSITPSITPSNNLSPKPNRAGAREVATASPSFGLGEVSPEVKAKAKSELEEMRETYLEQFSNAMRQAADCGNEDGPFYDKDIPAEYICCWITGSNAVGTWKAYVHKLGEEAVREECCLFQHERNAGENARNPAAALNARLNRMCEDKGGSDE